MAGRKGKGERALVQLLNTPEALAQHIATVARGANLDRSVYLCALLERLHGYPPNRGEQTVPLQLVEAPPRAKRRRANEYNRPGDSRDMLSFRVKKDLGDHMARAARTRGYASRAAYVYALVAQAHGWQSEHVDPVPFTDAPLDAEPLVELGPTGT